MPSSLKMLSACSLISGSILAYKFADFAMIVTSRYNMSFLYPYYTRLSAQVQYKFQIFFECLACLWHLPHYVFAHLTHRYAFIPTDEIIEKQQLFIFYS